MSEWIMRIKRNSTFRNPLLDIAEGVPTTFNSGELTLTPDDGTTPILLTQGNGKLLMPAFVWRSNWNPATVYVIGDVVLYAEEYYRASSTSTGVNPLGATQWDIFGQFIIVISKTEAGSYAWDRGDYCLDVVYGNGDEEDGYLTGRVLVEDAC